MSKTTVNIYTYVELIKAKGGEMNTRGNQRTVQTEQKIKSVTVDTQGETYPQPTKYPDPYGRF